MIDADLLRRWREREMTFPAFVRRMTPDAMDCVSGTLATLSDGPLGPRRDGHAVPRPKGAKG